MRSPITLVTLVTLLTTSTSALAAAPQLASLSSSSVPQSGRVRIFGAGFGAPPGLSPDARVEIGGVAVATARWSDAAISAYITDKVPLGETTLRVITSEGASEAVPLTVEPLPPPDGKIAWRLQIDGIGARHRVGVGPDGTVVTSDVLGYVYAIGEDGLLRWIHDAPRRAGYEHGSAVEGPVAVGADGTSYVGVEPLGPDLQLHAINPDGSLKWILNEPYTNTVSGPAIGPEGDIYWITTAQQGHGAQRITPEGMRVWSHVGDPVLDAAFYERSEELVFGPSQQGGPVDRLYFALTRSDLYQGMGTPPFLYGFDLDGQQKFANYVHSLSGSFSPRGQVAVGPDGRVYLASWAIPEGWRLHAYEPDSGERVWSYDPDPGNVVSAPEFDAAGNLYFMHDGAFLTSLDASGAPRWERTIEPGSRLGPSLSPDGGVILIDGIDIAPDGRLAAYAAETGELLWKYDFPLENGTFQAPSARARFTADGARAYVNTAIGGQPEGEEYAYLYAFDVGEGVDPGPVGETEGDGSTGGETAGGDGTTGDGTTGDGTSGDATTGDAGEESSGATEGSPGVDTGTGATGDDSATGGGSGDGSGDGCGCTTSQHAPGPGLLVTLGVVFATCRRRARPRAARA